MGKKGMAFFLACLTALAAWLCVWGTALERCAAQPGENAERIADRIADHIEKTEKTVRRDAGFCPELPVRTLQKGGADGEDEEDVLLSRADYEALLRIVEAEAGTEDDRGKLLVANVVLNRVEDEAFPDSVKQVVYQTAGGVAQFSPVADGSIDSVSVSQQTIRAVDRALEGEDISGGALYFAARQAADPEKMAWFDNHLTHLFSYGHHEFFR